MRILYHFPSFFSIPFSLSSAVQNPFCLGLLWSFTAVTLQSYIIATTADNSIFVSIKKTTIFLWSFKVKALLVCRRKLTGWRKKSCGMNYLMITSSRKTQTIIPTSIPVLFCWVHKRNVPEKRLSKTVRIDLENAGKHLFPSRTEIPTNKRKAVRL